MFRDPDLTEGNLSDRIKGLEEFNLPERDRQIAKVYLDWILAQIKDHFWKAVAASIVTALTAAVAGAIAWTNTQRDITELKVNVKQIQDDRAQRIADDLKWKRDTDSRLTRLETKIDFLIERAK